MSLTRSEMLNFRSSKVHKFFLFGEVFEAQKQYKIQIMTLTTNHQSRTWFFGIFLTISTLTFSQENNEGTAESDSLVQARREAYEVKVREMKRYERLRERDPVRFLDSLKILSKQRAKEKANERIKKYQSASFDELIEIDLTGAQLSEIPEFVFQASNLEILVLDDNQITELPKQLQKLTHLKRIYWRNNALNDSRVKVVKLKGIEKLDLSGNHLDRLPPIQRIQGIKELVLENNQFEKIQVWKIHRLKSLQELELSQNPIKIDRRWYGLLSQIEILKLNKCDLQSIHPSIYKMTNLKDLQLQVNRLVAIPEGISNLRNLSKLSFYKNEIDQLPLELFELENLELIDLYYNKLEIIPEQLAQLEKLKILYLSFNDIYDLPVEVGTLSNLEELYVHHNRLSEIPSSISNLNSLKVLHFQNNYVPQFPSFLLKMQSIRDLDISANDITEIPREIRSMQLDTFFWRDLSIDLNDPKNAPSIDAILEMIDRGVTVNPMIDREVSSLNSEPND